MRNSRRATTMLRVIALAAWPTFCFTEAYAHDYWRNGEPVPSWVKVVCCGRADAHRLRPDEVRRNAAGDYVVDIYPWPIAAQLALPSQDGDYWLFFYEDNGVYGRIGCFFVPYCFNAFAKPSASDQYLRIAAVHWVDANGSKPPF